MNRQSWTDVATGFGSSLRERPFFGGWVEAGTPLIVDALAAAGAAWIGVDLQHGIDTRGRLPEYVRAADVWGLPTVARIPHASADHVSGALDSGASAIIVPLVEDGATAASIAGWARFAPQGGRSWGPSRQVLQDGGITPRSINAAVLVFVMIESRLGYDNREEILSTPGIDGVIIGPSDLSISVTGGPPSQDLATEVDAMVADILITAQRHDVIPGYFCHDGEIAAIRAQEGFRIMPIGSDLGIVKAGWSAQHSAARGELATSPALGAYGA